MVRAQPGLLSLETLSDVDDHHKYVVLSEVRSSSGTRFLAAWVTIGTKTMALYGNDPMPRAAVEINQRLQGVDVK